MKHVMNQLTDKQRNGMLKEMREKCLTNPAPPAQTGLPNPTP